MACMHMHALLQQLDYLNLLSYSYIHIGRYSWLYLINVPVAIATSRRELHIYISYSTIPA